MVIFYVFGKIIKIEKDVPIQKIIKTETNIIIENAKT